MLWAGLHGLTTLGRSDRLRPGRDTERIELLVAQFHDASLKTVKEAAEGSASGSADLRFQDHLDPAIRDGDLYQQCGTSSKRSSVARCARRISCGALASLAE